MTRFTRRTLLAGSAALPIFSIATRPAHAAEFTYKWANNLPVTHPMNTRGARRWRASRTPPAGRLEIQIFPNNQLGSDTDTLSQLRSGAVEFFTLSGLILATLVPPASINGMGFAFPSYTEVWQAMDGGLGSFVRGEIGKRGLYAMERIWDNGFRQTTTSNRPSTPPPICAA
jgi:TRAP-type C4-dicarboxylate transport system substrate-binding protein